MTRGGRCSSHACDVVGTILPDDPSLAKTRMHPPAHRLSATRAPCVQLLLASILMLMSVPGCGGGQAGQTGARAGSDPVLPPPQRSLIPTVDIAPATGWPAGVTPTPSPGLRLTRFA